jgi:hypothetical protein
MKKLLTAVLFLNALICFGYEIETTRTEPVFNSIGLRFSNMSGYGISYSRRFADNYAITFTGIAFYDEFVKSDGDSIIQDTKNIHYDYGFELQRDFFKSQTTRVYMLGGLFFSTEANKDQWGGYASQDLKEDKIGCGLGIGIEFIIKETLALNVDFGYKFENNEGKENGKDFTSNKTLLGLGIGLSYLY